MKYTTSLEKINITPISSHFTIHVKINKTNAIMILDTGASQTVISSQFAKKSKLVLETVTDENMSIGISDIPISPQITEIKLFSISNLKIRNFQCFVLPLQHINETYKKIGCKPIDGILGVDILLMCKANINIKKLELDMYSKYENIDFKSYTSQKL